MYYCSLKVKQSHRAAFEQSLKDTIAKYNGRIDFASALAYVSMGKRSGSLLSSIVGTLGLTCAQLTALTYINIGIIKQDRSLIAYTPRTLSVPKYTRSSSQWTVPLSSPTYVVGYDLSGSVDLYNTTVSTRRENSVMQVMCNSINESIDNIHRDILFIWYIDTIVIDVCLEVRGRVIYKLCCYYYIVVYFIISYCCFFFFCLFAKLDFYIV